jgi:hypothetical protein
VIEAAWPCRTIASAERDGFRWINKHQNVTATVWRHYDVWNHGAEGGSPSIESCRGGFNALRGILDDAQAQGRRVRAVGRRWSLSPVAVCPDIMINTMPLNLHVVGLPASDVSTSSVDPSSLVFAQCGTSVLELSLALESRGLSLPTSGASNGQTICGAIATGTHGSARRVGAMQDYILGFHLLADNGHHYWIERASKPVVSEAFCQKLGATLRRDDRLFRAAVLSFGSFGVMHAVLFEAVPLYLLECTGGKWTGRQFGTRRRRSISILSDFAIQAWNRFTLKWRQPLQRETRGARRSRHRDVQAALSRVRAPQDSRCDDGARRRPAGSRRSAGDVGAGHHSCGVNSLLNAMMKVNAPPALGTTARSSTRRSSWASP